MINVAIVDDHPFIRIALKGFLEKHGFSVVLEAGNGLEAIYKIRQTVVDVLLIDLDIPKPNGIEVIKRVKAEKPEIKVVVLTGLNTDIYAQRCAAAGASAIMKKSNDIEQLIDIMRLVNNGLTVFPVSSDIRIIDPLKSEESLLKLLSNRELEILKYLCQGQSNSGIAAELSISHKTVSTHKTNLMVKLNMHSLSELIIFAQKVQLLSA